MANAEVRLKVSKASYTEKITKLERLINRCDSAISRYETLERTISKFMDETDDNFENTRLQVQQNIKMVRKSREMCEANIKMLRETLQNMEEFGQEVGKMASETIQAAKNTLNTAIEVTKLLS